MSGFSKIKLGEAVTFQRGFDITKAEQTPGEVPIVSSSGVSSTHNKSKVTGPGVIIGRKGTLGTVHFIRQDYWPHDTTLWVKDFKGNNPQFIAYFVRTLKLETFDTGSSNPTLNRNHLHKINVIFPKEPKTQRKIAAILTAYDDLIDTNKRRIALLENMAEEIYREWFVRMRFPGHQNTKLAKGLPEGWEAQPISGFAAFKYGYTESAIIDNALPKFLRITDINKSSFVNWSTVPNCPISDTDYNKLQLRKHDILIARMADPGRVAIVESDVRAVFASYLIKIHYDKLLVKPYFLFYTLSMGAFLDYFRGANSGATRGSINASLIGKTKIVVPLYSVQSQFEELVIPIREQLLKLLIVNQNITDTRDLLLPRLISGKISVADLDIQFPPSMCEGAKGQGPIS